jgi:hypothetical protein
VDGYLANFSSKILDQCLFFLADRKGNDMDRILALQGLSSYADLEPIDGTAGSCKSGICSVQSSGQGASSCSLQCKAFEEMDW